MMQLALLKAKLLTSVNRLYKRISDNLTAMKLRVKVLLSREK